MQVDVGQHRGDNPSLWAAGYRVHYLPVDVQNAGFEPFPDKIEKGPVVDPQFQHPHQPVVVEVIEEAFDVGFYDVTRTCRTGVLKPRSWTAALGTSRPVGNHS